MAVDERGFGIEELDAGYQTVARRLRALQGGLRAVERTRLPASPADGLVLDLNAAEAGASPLALPLAPALAASDDLAEPQPAPIPEPAAPEPSRPPAAERQPSVWSSFWAWWRQERESRERVRRARALAAEAERLRDLRALQPAAVVEQTQALRSVMTFTEERFQALSLRSEALHDELAGISRSLVALAGRPDGSPVSSGSAEDLRERLDHLILSLADDRRRREQELRAISEQMTIQTAELATLLEDALLRMRTLIPEEMGAVAERISATVEDAVGSLPPGSVFDPPPAKKVTTRAKRTAR